MTKEYQPTEAKIQRVLSMTGSNPRKLAVAYLRAQHRARSNALAVKVMEDVNQSMYNVATGNLKGAKSALEQLKRRLGASKHS